MTSSLASAPRLYRRPDHGWLGGVAAGIAEHVGVSRRTVRLAFAVLGLGGGLGVALYGAYLIVLPAAPDAGAGRFPRWLEYSITAICAAAAVGFAATSLPRGGLFVSALLACLGGALIWRQAAEPERVRLRRLSHASLVAGGDQRLGRVRLAAGAALVVGGGVLVLARADVSAVRDGVLAVLVTVVGLAMITGPWWVRLVTQLSAERAERIRSEERADIAARLHDSVLQTLALIQRNAASPREVVRLARGQERELRALLYPSAAGAGRFADRLRGFVAEVEDDYAVEVDLVVVGDAALDEPLVAASAAAREALVNAAKHSGVTSVSLYAEVEDDAVRVYVKDRGAGFDLAAVGPDRQGVRGSIVQRVERQGGNVRIFTAPGEGTDIAITVPVS